MGYRKVTLYAWDPLAEDGLGDVTRLNVDEAGDLLVARRNLITELDYDASGNVIYFGQAEPGTPTTDAKWQIRKLDYDGSGNLLSMLWAEGVRGFVNAWTGRASLSYF